MRNAVRTIRQILTMTGLLALAPAAHAGTLYVATNGLDGPDCGPKAQPCRSISQAIGLAPPRSTIIVGPGRYGDLNGNGILGETGEETGGCLPPCASPPCFVPNPPPTVCMLRVHKDITLVSSDGAAATVIDARAVLVGTNVRLDADGGAFGRPGQGFTVTNTKSVAGRGIVINADNNTVRGNQVLNTFPGDPVSFAGVGIDAIAGAGPIVIEENQVINWVAGIVARGGPGTTVSKNHVSLSTSGFGIFAQGTTEVVGNIATANGAGIALRDAASAVGNVATGNVLGILVESTTPFSGIVEKNNLFGNLFCGLQNTGAPGVLAARNYWGAATGPGAEPADEVCNVSGATTIVVPFASKPFAVNPALRP
jgi:hypothetical protein